jgi:hypothetical protein
MAEEQEELTPMSRYEDLATTRTDYEDRAEALASLTIPYLYTADGSSSSTEMGDSYGARYAANAINTLVAQMVLTLLPASGSSFRFDPDSDALEELTQGSQDARAQVMALLGKESNRVNKEIENQMIRPVFHDFLLNMCAVSPVVVEKVKGNGIKWHNIDNFVVKLDDRGEPLEIIILETLDKFNLPDGIEVDTEGEDEDVELYTWCKLREGKWTVTQSIGNEPVGKESTFNKDMLPYVYLGWTRQKGDTYHRPYAEQYQGLLEDYAIINKVLIEGAVISSKVNFLVNPLGSTQKKSLADAANGDILDGREEDVSTLQVGKNYDFQVAMEQKRELQTAIDRAFLTRQTQAYAGRERVTAEEIRADAQDLEKNLAGMYSIMSKKFSKWLVMQIMKELGIKFDAIDVNVITGLDALGKNIEAQKMDMFMNRLAGLGLNQWIKESELVTRYATYEGIDLVGLVKTPNEVQQERQQAAQAQQAQMLMESGATQAGQNLANKALPAE